MKFTSNAKEVLAKMKSQQKLALMAVGEYVEGEAKVRTPVDTGRLRGSIEHREHGDTSVMIGSNVEYAAAVEMGYRRRAAKPYLRPAAEENLGNITKIVEQHMKEVGDG